MGGVILLVAICQLGAWKHISRIQGHPAGLLGHCPLANNHKSPTPSFSVSPKEKYFSGMQSALLLRLSEVHKRGGD